MFSGHLCRIITLLSLNIFKNVKRAIKLEGIYFALVLIPSAYEVFEVWDFTIQNMRRSVVNFPIISI